MLNSPSGISKSTTLSGIQNRIPGSGMSKLTQPGSKLATELYLMCFLPFCMGLRETKLKVYVEYYSYSLFFLTSFS